MPEQPGATSLWRGSALRRMSGGHLEKLLSSIFMEMDLLFNRIPTLAVQYDGQEMVSVVRLPYQITVSSIRLPSPDIQVYDLRRPQRALGRGTPTAC